MPAASSAPSTAGVRRRFAYEIAHQNEGYYFVTNFRAPEDVVDKLRRTLQISDEYVRGKILHAPGNGWSDHDQGEDEWLVTTASPSSETSPTTPSCVSPPRVLPVANFTIAVNRRFKNQSGQWEDKLDGFFKCNCWREMAENVAESLQKGMRVMVVGRLQQRSWDDQEGNKRSAFEIQVDEVGPSLRWATANVTEVAALVRWTSLRRK